MTLGRTRAALGLVLKKPTLFLTRCDEICTGLETHPAVFVAPNPPLPALRGQYNDAFTAQAAVRTNVKGATEVRKVKFGLLLTSMESELAMVQGLCDASPGNAGVIIAAAAMVPVAVGVAHKPLLGLKNILPSGSVLLEANAGLLDISSRQKFYNWMYTLDGGKTFLPMPPTPEAKTTIANLTPLTTVGFQVSVTVNKLPQGPWSHVEYIVVR